MDAPKRMAWILAAFLIPHGNAGARQCVGDIDSSAVVDGADLGLLLSTWGTGDSTADLNADGVVDGVDLGILLGAWGACRDVTEHCTPAWLPTFETTTNDEVRALVIFDDGLGDQPALYVGGDFTSVGGEPANHIARWDGTTWSALGGGIDGPVHALAVFDDGSGAALYAGGDFATVAGVDGVRVVANGVARWDPLKQSWSALNEGLSGGWGTPVVNALLVFDDGAGPALYVGGQFATAGGIDAGHIAGWNGKDWFDLDGGMTGIIPRVESLAIFDDGSGEGPCLYAGGLFFTAGETTASHIARWNGRDWAPLGIGVGYAPVYALTAFDGAEGPVLIAGGAFNAAGMVNAAHIAQWNGKSWSALGEGVDQPVWALATFDDGAGEGSALVVGGGFITAGDQPIEGIAKWAADGSGWAPLGSGMYGPVLALTTAPDGPTAGPSLLAGGNFTANDSGDVHLARWGCSR